MQTRMLSVTETLGFLLPYYHAQKIGVVIGRFGGGTLTGELMKIDEREIVINDDGDEIVVAISTIESLAHSQIFDGKLAEAS